MFRIVIQIASSSFYYKGTMSFIVALHQSVLYRPTTARGATMSHFLFTGLTKRLKWLCDDPARSTKPVRVPLQAGKQRREPECFPLQRQVNSRQVIDVENLGVLIPLHNTASSTESIPFRSHRYCMIMAGFEPATPTLSP